MNDAESTELDLEIAAGEEKDRLQSLKETQMWGIFRDSAKAPDLFRNAKGVPSATEMRQLLASNEEMVTVDDDTFSIAIEGEESEEQGDESKAVESATDVEMTGVNGSEEPRA